MHVARIVRLGWRASIALWLAMAAARVAAQETTGTIVGSVVDEQGQVLPGSTVTAINERTNVSRVVSTDSRGDFQLTTLPPGSYTVKVELANFRGFESKRNVLSAADRLSLGTVRLTVGLGESVVVESTGTRVGTEDSQHTGLITSRQIEQIQVKGRDVTSLMRLVPGVRYEDTVESLGESFGTLVPNVGGARRDWNTIMVDGVLGNEVGQANRMAQQVNLDAVGEVKVLLNTYRAEYGRTGGAQVQIVTKGGGSEYAGNAYYYGRHEKLNANNFFNNAAGRPRPRYRYNTFGFNLGGPIPGLNKGQDKKLFFFYSIEAPLTERPGNLRSFRVPSEAERRGDFSQTRDLNGNLIVIRDPLTGQPFPGNVIPANRINPNGQALLNLLPVPNVQGQRGYNFERQETAENPKMNNVLRIDWKPSDSDSLYVTFKDWYSDQRGSEITAGPAKWGWFNTHYLNTDRGGSINYTKIFRSNLINEAAAGVRRQTEQFHPVTDQDWARLRRADNGFNFGQLNPALNRVNALPKVQFTGLALSAGAELPNLAYENRLIGDGGAAWVYSFRNNLTWIKGSHAFKGGVYLEMLRNTEGPGGVGAGPWSGEFFFNTDTANPLDTRHPFSNALLGVFREYREVDALPEVKAKRHLAEWYVQDTWKASSRLTLDAGIRFLWYKPWDTSLPAATFVPELFDPARAPRLYQPGRVNNQNVAIDPLTGQVLPNVFVGAFVPGTGDPTNGMVLNGSPGYPRGFRDNQGIHPEPRLGLAYELTGDGKTSLHASAGLYHNAHITARSMDQAANNPPAVSTPSIFYASMDTLLGARGTTRPSSVFALERDAKTPSSYNWSIGVQREIGWGTVVDLTYVGNVTRHLELAQNINVVPDGAKFLDQNPQNRNPQNPNSPLPDTFLRPYRGYEDITLRSHHGTSNYNGLQVQINRRYIDGFQFAVAYTYAKALGVADEDEQQVSAVRPLLGWHYAPLAGTQTHTLVVNYTWDLPRASALANNGVVRFLFDNWQLSGENAFVSGDWTPVFMTTVDNFDFTGGTGGNGGDAGGGVRVVRPLVVGSPLGGGDAAPGAPGSWLNAAAFARPGRGATGNAGRYVFRGPGINNWNLSLFKNFPIGNGRRRVQFRVEAYNVLNHTQFGPAPGVTVNAGTGGQGIDNTLRFDAAGNQINANFGKATSARNARIIQGAIRLTF